MDPLLSSSRMADLDRRLRLLELAEGTCPRRQYDADELCSLYLHATSAQVQTLANARLWFTVVLGLGVEDLATLATTLQDPFPWRPFLTRLDALVASGLVGVQLATDHLLEIARELMVAQGIGDVVSIGDVLAGPTVVESALLAISEEKGRPRHDRLRRKQHP